MTDARTRYVATYHYPGLLFSEDVSRPIAEPTWEAVLAAAPSGDEFPARDGWYAAEVTAIREKRFVAGDGEEAWVEQTRIRRVEHWVIGDRYHWSEIEDSDRNSILISNIKGNSRDGGYGVLTRSGNWQIASDYKTVIPATEAVSA